MIRAHRLSSLLLALLMLLCVLPLSACHGSRGRAAFTVPESFDRSRQYEITFWAKNDTNKVQTAIYQKAISDFQALYPNITVNMRLYTDYGRIYNDVITNIDHAQCLHHLSGPHCDLYDRLRRGGAAGRSVC